MERATILFVDDDAEQTAQRTIGALEQAGHEVIYYDHIPPALRVVTERPIALVITDIAVRADNLTSLVQSAKNQDPPVPVIVLDGLASDLPAVAC